MIYYFQVLNFKPNTRIMKKCITKPSLLGLCLGLFIISCSKEIDDPTVEELSSVKATTSLKMDIPSDPSAQITFNMGESGLIASDFAFQSVAASIVEPSECGPTPFRDVFIKYDDLLFNDFLAHWDFLSLDPYFMIFFDYPIINQIAARFEDVNIDYFGADGEYTHYVNNRVRSLENFWDMRDLISVRGQHSETLEDIDFIRFVYENYVNPPLEKEVVDALVGYAEFFNNVSDQIPENPLMAADGFATFDRKIVVGDGIITLLAETGLDPKVVWSSILAHEWGHQMQFLNYGAWAYPLPAFSGSPESTRMTELEADFLTGYYLTHKGGATYNWKRVEDVLEGFFNIGDCGFTSGGHHGTPLQRMEAARQGYELAANTKKKGKIMTQSEVHDAFLSVLNDIVGNGTGAENGPAFQ